MIVGPLAALIAAGCYGLASVLQAIAARAAPQTAGVDPRLLLRLLRRGPFLGGLLLDTAGFAAQFFALRHAPVFLVQAALAASLAVTALAAVPILGAVLRHREWVAIGTVSVGLATLAASAGAEGAGTVGSGVRFALLGCTALLAVAGFAAGHLRDPIRSALLGLVAGLGFGIVALAARAAGDLSPAHLLRDPAGYAAIAGAGLGFLFYATALQRHAVTIATAAMVVGETFLPSVVGVLLLGDRTRSGFAPVALVGFALALAGALALARFGEAPEPDPAPQPLPVTR